MKDLNIKPWYKKKRYLITLGVVGLMTLASMSDNQTATYQASSDTIPSPRVEQSPSLSTKTQETSVSVPTKQVTTPVQEPEPVVIPVKTKTESQCHPSYSGCLKVNSGDYDCASGSGNGPNYTGSVQVFGYDEFDLDRDHDGWGCEKN